MPRFWKFALALPLSALCGCAATLPPACPPPLPPPAELMVPPPAPGAAQKALEHARQVAPGAGEWCVARLADLELDLRVSALTDLGTSRGDGERMVLELGVRDLIVACRGR